MSQINLKSITGITSITTPGGVDDVFTVHSNDTTERFRVDSNGNQVIAGILTVSQDIDVDGHTNVDNLSIAGVTTFSDSDIHFKNNGITSCRYDSDQGRFLFNHNGGLHWYKNGNLSNSSGASISYSEFSNQYKGLVIQAPWQGQNNAKNVTVMGSSNGRFVIQSNLNASETVSVYFEGGVNLSYYQSGNKLQTTPTGVTLNQDLTVNRNALITGISTFTGAIDANSNLEVAGTSKLSGDVTINRTTGLLNSKLSINKDADQEGIGIQLNQSSGITTSFTTFNSAGTQTFSLAHDTDGTPDLILKLKHSTDSAPAEKLRITSGGTVNIGGDYTNTTGKLKVTGVVTVDGGFNLTAGTLTAPGGFSISSGNVIISGDIAHDADSDTTFGFGSGADTFRVQTAGSERLRIDSSGRLYLGSNFTGGNGDVDDLVISGTGNKGITVCSTDGGNVRITFADGLSSTAAVIGSIVYEHSVDAMDFYTNALRMMRVDRANSTERLQIGSTNNSSSGTRLVLGSGNNIAATAVINTQDTNINALTLSNWDGSTTTNKVNMHFDCSGIAGFDVGIPAQTPDFKISNTSGGGGYINMKSTGETKIYRSGVMLADINNSVQGHQFISQSNDNEDGFQVYNQHGSTTSRYTFACYDNRSGSKGRSFGVRGDGKSIFYGDVLPSADIAYDLGSDSYTWEKFYYKNAYPEQSTEYRITSGSYSNGQWHDTAFGRDNMGGLDLNGIYIVTCFADLYNAMGGNYQCNYTWIVGMRNQYTNQTLVNTCPLLSVTGHSTNNFGASGATVGDGIRLGTSRTPATSGGEEQIVWRPAASTSAINNTAGRTLVFRCQRIGRSSLG